MTTLRRGWARRLMIFAGLLAAALSFPAGSGAQQPPGPPDFAWPYGIVQADGANLDPAVQPVIALVNGKACGDGVTQVAAAGPGTPASDVGKTVYVVDVLADGSGPGQRPGCGAPGLPIRLWFPVARRFALQEPLFAPGGQRADVDLGPALPFRLTAPQAASDGVN
ncbi:hypothetical protein [Tepidiforma sp.]|uniref:hypothetical protein n=1 Tax=Tepidiforma sp. TaxID=2682230 RepID=UPI0021DE6E77|nr:hypothetical protein [Tepidiforma sp.]MCX7618639.1 hypothetical protein [Tepidiforma sp.]GIW18864.1 MAG: hypothetical protein KatS3mg064_2021 [Tepidiforma sp.]